MTSPICIFGDWVGLDEFHLKSSEEKALRNDVDKMTLHIA